MIGYTDRSVSALAGILSLEKRIHHAHSSREGFFVRCHDGARTSGSRFSVNRHLAPAMPGWGGPARSGIARDYKDAEDYGRETSDEADEVDCRVGRRYPLPNLAACGGGGAGAPEQALARPPSVAVPEQPPEP